MEDIETRLDSAIKRLVKEELERVMGIERDVFLEHSNGTRNGHYERDLTTKYGHIDDLKVPRDREGTFRTQIFQPYQRYTGIEDFIAAMYAKGMSTAKIGDILEELFHHSYSRSTISRITDVLVEEIGKWQGRPLKQRYTAIMIDAMFFNMRRGTVEKECVHFALGIDDEGHEEILGFWLNPTESSTGWEPILSDLKRRGAAEVLLFVADALSGIEESVKRQYPRSDFQSCTVHAMRNALSKVRASDRYTVAGELKTVFNASSREEAGKRFKSFSGSWNKRYPKMVYALERSFDALTGYYGYPESIRRSICSTNIIERMNREVRGRIKIIDSLPTEDGAVKIIYSRVIELNSSWSNRTLNGFAACREDVQEMFDVRYPVLTQDS